MSDISRAELKYLVERQREEIRTLNQAGKLLSGTSDPQAVIRLIISYLHLTFPIAFCGIWLLDQRQLYTYAFAPISQVEISNTIRNIRSAISNLLKRPVTEAETIPVFSESGTPTDQWMASATTLRSHWFAPLSVNGQPIGLLGVFSGQEEAFTKEDHHAIGVVAEQLASALRNAFLLQELRRADELKNQLLSIVSHELSTPLTAIKEGVNLVFDGSLGTVTSDQQEFLNTVIQNAERLDRLIQKVKVATELMTSQTQFTVESYDLRTLLSHVEKNYRSLAKEKRVHLKVVGYPKPLFWSVDKTHLTMALEQLVENAIQATPKEGLVTLKLAATPMEAQFQVLDTGCGIAKEALPNLFDRFQSIGGIHDRKMGGFGLGLSIAKALVEGQGGEISVESILDEGTQMTIHISKRT